MNKNDIPIDSPCDADWDSMTKEGRHRFCDSCRKNVHDLSSMTRGEVVDLLRENANLRMCFRYIHDADGNILFSDDERLAWKRELVAEFVMPASRLVRTRRALVLTAVAPFAATACHTERPLIMMGGGCPDGSSIESVQKSSLAVAYKIDRETGERLTRELQAAMNLKALANTLDHELTTSCAGISSDLGGHADAKTVHEACEAAFDSLRIARETLGQGATVKVDLTPPRCVMPMARVATCTAACERKGVFPEASFTCQGKTYCAGQCQGTCEREGNISPRLAGECKGGCSGPCEGVTSCDGPLQSSGASRECQASCEAEALASSECFPSKVDVTVTGASDAQMAAVLSETLRKHLGAIASLSLSRRERLVRLRPIAAAIYEDARTTGKHLATPTWEGRLWVCSGHAFEASVQASERIQIDLDLAHDVLARASGRDPHRR